MSDGTSTTLPAKAMLTVGERTFDLPVVRSSIDGGDIGLNFTGFRNGDLLNGSHLITLDVGGLGSTGAVQSGITYIDGGHSLLLHLGYPIEELAAQCSFEEVMYLLINGQLPTVAQLTTFGHQLSSHARLNHGISDLMPQLPKGMHPMAMLVHAVNCMTVVHSDCLNPLDPTQVREAVNCLLGGMPQIVAAICCTTQGRDIKYLDLTQPYSFRLLKAMTGKDPSPAACRAMEVLLIAHADHEQNCSTSAVRLVGSSHANLFASIVAGICALWGPLHGGANEACVAQLRDIQEGRLTIENIIAGAQDKSSGIKLMGFGHRVYKSFDPRAALIKQLCHELLAEIGGGDALFQIAKELEAAALADDYFQRKNLWPNVDFYSGIIYTAMGIPPEMFTVLFALGRLPGWIAHWQEAHAQKLPITRPRQIYNGHVQRPVTPIDARG